MAGIDFPICRCFSQPPASPPRGEVDDAQHRRVRGLLLCTLNLPLANAETSPVPFSLPWDLLPAVALYKADPGEFRTTLESRFGSKVVVMAKTAAPLKPFEGIAGWRPIRDRGVAAWTDDFSNIVGALIRKYREP